MKKLKINFILFMLVAFSLGAQSNNNVTFSQESVVLQYNESLLFSGEYLKYKMYCIDSNKKKLTGYSKIGYVTLVNNKGKEVFSHKITLANGAGYGDFFIPTAVPTGSYKLLGYTQLMINSGIEYFFQADINIINPYQATKREFIADSSAVSGINVAATPTKNKSPYVSLNLDKSLFNKRDKVALKITSDDSAGLNGNYNLSIKKISAVTSPVQKTSTSVLSSIQMNKGIGAVKNLPELRGETISGSIINKESKQPAVDLKVSLSLPGEDYLFKIATTNSKGEFSFILDRSYDNLSGALQVLSDNWDAYEVNLDNQKIDYSRLKYADFAVSKLMQDYILDKSIKNQIENAYRDTKKDVILPVKQRTPFYRKLPITYNLEDYTRFNTLKETIVELIGEMNTRKLSNGNQIFEVRPEEGFSGNNLMPAVFVDGLFINKHQDFMDYSSKKIKSISLSRDKIILGTQAFQGVVLFTTIKGDFYEEFYTPQISKIDLFKPQSNKEYYNPAYTNTKAENRIPDFRYQLLWEPNLVLSKDDNVITFFTSDIEGEYEVVVEGFTSNGTPVSINEYFTVE